MESFFEIPPVLNHLEKMLLSSVRVFIEEDHPEADKIKDFFQKRAYFIVNSKEEAEFIVKKDLTLKELEKAYNSVFSDKDVELEGRFSRTYAFRAGYRLNPDSLKVYEILRGLATNRKKYGFRYCPCRPLSGNKREDAKKICPCFWHRMEIEEMGHCHCGLFFRK